MKSKFFTDDEMIDDWFYRTATDFRWTMHDPVSDGRVLYVRYTFSYILFNFLFNSGIRFCHNN